MSNPYKYPASCASTLLDRSSKRGRFKKKPLIILSTYTNIEIKESGFSRCLEHYNKDVV